jgi:hypothetical protein
MWSPMGLLQDSPPTGSEKGGRIREAAPSGVLQVGSSRGFIKGSLQRGSPSVNIKEIHKPVPKVGPPMGSPKVALQGLPQKWTPGGPPSFWSSGAPKMVTPNLMPKCGPPWGFKKSGPQEGPQICPPRASRGGLPREFLQGGLKEGFPKRALKGVPQVGLQRRVQKGGLHKRGPPRGCFPKGSTPSSVPPC